MSSVSRRTVFFGTKRSGQRKPSNAGLWAAKRKRRDRHVSAFTQFFASFLGKNGLNAHIWRRVFRGDGGLTRTTGWDGTSLVAPLEIEVQRDAECRDDNRDGLLVGQVEEAYRIVVAAKHLDDEAVDAVGGKVGGHEESREGIPVSPQEDKKAEDHRETEGAIELRWMNRERPMVVERHVFKSPEVLQVGVAADGVAGGVPWNAARRDAPCA